MLGSRFFAIGGFIRLVICRLLFLLVGSIVCAVVFYGGHRLHVISGLLRKVEMRKSHQVFICRLRTSQFPAIVEDHHYRADEGTQQDAYYVAGNV